MKNNAATQETKRRLIEAAGEVFAEVGFERATVKEITERAKASIAAVNYHFDDKRALYVQAVRLAFEPCATLRDVLGDPSVISLEPEARFRRTVWLLLQNMLADEGTPEEQWRCALMTREIQQPTDASDEPIQTAMRAVGERLIASIAALFPKRVTPTQRQLVLLSNSVLGQCIFYAENQSLLMRLQPDMPAAADCLDELATHIADVILASIRHARS